MHTLYIVALQGSERSVLYSGVADHEVTGCFGYYLLSECGPSRGSRGGGDSGNHHKLKLTMTEEALSKKECILTLV